MKNPSGARLQTGYWCECTVSTIDSEQGPMAVTAFGAGSASEAVVGVIVAMQRLMPDSAAEQAEAARASFDRALATHSLIGGHACAYTVTRGDMRVNWTLRPVLFLPLAHGPRRNTPSCSAPLATYLFSPPAVCRGVE